MRILIDIGHPGHVHLIRNLYHILKQNNHSLWIMVKDIPLAKSLMDIYGIEYIDLGGKKDSLIGKGLSQINYNRKALQLVIKHKIDLGIGSSITLAHVSKLTKMKSIILDDDDDEVQPLFVKYAHPFADVILSPESLIGHRKNRKTIFYAGFHELAYLHPNRFLPDENVLSEVGLKKGEPFFVMRFNVFKAHHDVGINGISLANKLELIKLLKLYGPVYITTEREIEPELKQYQLPVSPEKAHSLMYYATMFLGDSQTMTSEAAVLGTPAIRMNSFVGRIAYLEEEEHKYGLTYGFNPDQFDKMASKIKELLGIPNIKGEWQKRCQKMLADKIDVTAFMVWFVENYPQSAKIMKENPDYQYKFK